MGIFEKSELGKAYEDNFLSLCDSIIKDKCCFFVGAGISKDLKYPDWKNLIKDLIAEVKRITGETIIFDERKIDENNLKEIADECKSKLSVEDYEEFLYNIFYDNPFHKFISLHSHIINLPVKVFITTNYDNCLEYTIYSNNDYDKTSINCFYYPQLDPTYLPDNSVFHVHGGINFKIPQKNKIAERFILSKKDYIRAYKEETFIDNFLSPIFTNRKVIFIGSNIEENLRAILRKSIRVEEL